MATAEEYAKWIVDNQDKKGTPEFETVAKAYQVSRQPAEAPKQEPRKIKKLFGGEVTITPQEEAGLAAAKAKPWGSGVPKFAEDAGGAVTDVTGSPALGAATNTAIQGIPILLTSFGVQKAAAPVMEGAAKGLMKSALKPPAAAQVGGAESDAAKAVQTLLDEGANVSSSGALKLRESINKLHGEVMQKIQASPEVVDKAYAMKQVHDVLEKFRSQVNPGADVKKILDAWGEFNQLVGNKIPVQQAQALKQGTYKVLADKYAKMGAVENEAATQAQMGLARGLRQGIEDVVPGVGALNAKESQLINALELSERRAGIAGNKDLGGIAWLAQNPAAAAAMMADRSAAFKSWLANKIYAMRNAGPALAGAGAAAAYQQMPNE